MCPGLGHVKNMRDSYHVLSNVFRKRRYPVTTPRSPRQHGSDFTISLSVLSVLCIFFRAMLPYPEVARQQSWSGLDYSAFIFNADEVFRIVW
jgi:hypothetical protein